MTTTPTSVDALRTRLARAFEVAALRDPSAELAAFEAAVRADERDHVSRDLTTHAEAMEKDGGFVGLHRSDSALAALWWAARRTRDHWPPP